MSRFIVKIPTDEDTLNPRPSLLCNLQEIRKVGCGGYVMLLANGIQMARLLRFSDQTRTIDTRARFIMLHDYRLFQPEMHYLWKRIVNVVFVRPLRNRRALDRRIQSEHGGTVYELSTVPFPIPLKGIFFSKILNFWQNGKFRTLPNSRKALFGDKTNDLQGQLMHVAVLEHTPAVFKSNVPAHTLYYGVEIELLKAIANVMHFRMSFYETPDAETERWGVQQDNGKLTGLLGEMREGRADFALADLHHTQYHLAFMDLSTPYNTECLTFLTPEALSDNSWKTLILPFNGEMWAGVLVSLFSVGFVFYAFSNILAYMHRHERAYRPDYDLLQRRRHRKQRRLICAKLHMVPFKRRPEPWHDPLPAQDIFDTFSGCILYTYSMLLLVSLPRIPAGWPLRVLTGCYWVYCLLLVVAYRASFTAILANPVPRLTIDTLHDLAASPISCGAWGEQNRLFLSAIGIVKLEHAPNAEDAVERVVEGMYAYYENIYLLRELRSTRKSEKARQTLHIMQECAVHMPVSIGLEKNSPLKPQVDRYVRALIEGGLTGKWLSDAIERFQSNVELPPQEATIDLKKMYAGLVALAIGYSVSIMALAAEKLYWRFVVETNPAFDKYLLGLRFSTRRG
ncbi:glutamate receptor ionotropic, kainate glr-3 [Anopheles darlingi]|uniref:glutamate receptor ionotropic, kainate glr-3 n=1 Tax=Anopheles darlingi TaxID=43151 RepID=UPI0021001F6A|nr:glutamate receptor ionotropic, kainate glr-3 [Anopheles darlingi]